MRRIVELPHGYVREELEVVGISDSEIR